MKLQNHWIPRFAIDDPLPAKAPYDPYKFARCRHHHHSLRACWKPAGHDGPHANPNLIPTAPWRDEDGVFVTSREIWSALIDQLGIETTARQN